jgi:HEPN domain-containing protein
MALWYASRSKVQLREALSHFARYRYPESVACSQESIELGLKAIFEFFGESYPPDHDAFARDVNRLLRTLSQRLSAYNQQLSRATLISNRWASMARSLARYGQQALRVPGSQIISRSDAESAKNDAEEIANLLHTIERSQKFRFVIQVAILNGYVEGASVSEIPCSSSPFTSFSLNDWETFFQSVRVGNQAKFNVSRISASEISNRFAVILDPFGEAYPEKDFRERVVFDIINDYVADGGLFVTTGGFAFYYGWDVNPNVQGDRARPILDDRVFLPVIIRLGAQNTFAVEQFRAALPFSGSLLWKQLGAQTTGDTPAHSGSYVGQVHQTPEDQSVVGDLVNIGGSDRIREFRALTPGSANCLPLLRLRRPDLGEVYPICAIHHGRGYFIIGGMNNASQVEFDKLANAVDRFCDWFSRQP